MTKMASKYFPNSKRNSARDKPFHRPEVHPGSTPLDFNACKDSYRIFHKQMIRYGELLGAPAI